MSEESKFYAFNESVTPVPTFAKKDPTSWERFKLDEDKEALIRFLYAPIFHGVIHTEALGNNKFVSLRCTAASVETGGRCVGCYQVEAKNKFFKTREIWAMPMIDYRMIHKVENDKGRTESRPCLGKIRCSFCKEGYAPEEIGRRYWEVGSYHAGAIRTANSVIGKRCLSCKEGKILIASISCKKCGEPLFSDSQMASMQDSTLMEKLKQRFTCPACQHQGFPKEQVACSHCEHPVRASIFDTDLIIIKTKAIETETGKQSKLIGLNIEPTYKYEPVNEKYLTLPPYDFEKKIYPQLSLDIQAAMYKVVNPWRGSDTADEISTPADEEKDIFITPGDKDPV